MGSESSSASRELSRRADRVLAGGVNSNMRLGTRGRFFASAQGSRLVDVDGQEYVDYVLGGGPSILGHADEGLLRAVTEACRHGTVYGGQHTLEVEVAERLLALLDWADRVRLGSTGSEMVHVALRLARAATGRRTVIRFRDHYHGWLDGALVDPEAEEPRPASAGQSPESCDDIALLAWNDVAALTDAFARGDVAGVIMEPVMANAGVIAPRPGYLETVRRLCDEAGSLLVFDETVTGFRLGTGGAAECFGVRPDLAVYGKALGGGWPIAALAGTEAAMDELTRARVTHQGTFNGAVVGSAAAIATLERLADGTAHAHIEHIGRRLLDGLADIAGDADGTLRVQGFPSMFQTAFIDAERWWDHGWRKDADRRALEQLVGTLARSGVWVAPRGVWYVSAAHTEQDVDRTIAAVGTALAAEHVAGR